jgi:hypothetical protein
MSAPSLRRPAAALSPFRDAEYPEDPYPGARPNCSFVHLDGLGYPVEPDDAEPSGWRLAGEETERTSLDDWLTERGAPPLADRQPVLAYGSNVCPEKITWLRENLGLRGPAVVLRARCTDMAAVWSMGHRKRDGQRPAVLAAAPGVVEQHAVWFATPEQRRVLDRCEGRSSGRYRLVRLHEPTGVHLENGESPQDLLAYTAASEAMAPLVLGGRPVRCAEVGQRVARHLVGTPATSDGLSCTEITGEPTHSLTLA